VNLFDLLACPACKRPVVRAGADALRCEACARLYPIRSGVPIMLADPEGALVEHEAHLGVRDGYTAWKDRVIVQSLSDAQVVLDFGAGRQALDDPCIIRMDLTFNRWVDVVGDVQALPFLPGSIDFAFGGAVMEHVPNPWRAVDELWQVLKPGGYVYADWNFIIAYHGYPHHYYNATRHGVTEAFKRFSILEVGEAPFHLGSMAMTSFIATYLRHFQPRTRIEHDFALHLTKVLWYPIEEYDLQIPAEDRFRVASSAYVLGIKQPQGTETVLPAPVMQAWEASSALQARFPRPWDLSRPDNLMRWAKREGVSIDSAIREYFATLVPFSKYGDGRRFERPVVSAWPVEILEGAIRPVDHAERAHKLWESHSLWLRLREGRERGGVKGMLGALMVTMRHTRAAAAALLRTLRDRGRRQNRPQTGAEKN
jgi:uncharacterized protein YbaR (Trm112 family)/SAM-dependent methyltransferase